MSIEDSFKLFCSRLDDWLEVKNLKPPKFSEDFNKAESLSMDELDRLTRDECFNHAYMLYQYADHVGSEKASLMTAINWCDTSINEIVARNYNETYQYAKHDIKVAEILIENSVAKKIAEWKLVAQARLESLVGREQNVRRKAECLIEKGKRK